MNSFQRNNNVKYYAVHMLISTSHKVECVFQAEGGVADPKNHIHMFILS